MSPRPRPPHWPGQDVPRNRHSGRYATGQLLALLVIALISLPLLPLLLLIIAWIRLRDRAQSRSERRAARRASTTPTALVHGLLSR
ncbi:hypothetical protein ACIBF5_11020 [Micromonospora sp. NPDC050417]|uniref:hypothetical protein n=1 Tax=Micromonospora sp. NPDC050417 TaxID=3364280 RepID=UPI0037970E09